MTRIMAIADIHGDTNLVKKLAKKAKDEKVDIIIIPGDLTWIEELPRGIIEPFTKLNKDILIIPGNHETQNTIELLKAQYPNIKNIHGKGIKEKDIGIFGAGYSQNTGPFWAEEEEIFKALKRGHEQIRNTPKKIMITHAHHKGSKAEFTGFEGSEAVKKAIEKFRPDIVLNGHIHEAGGIEEKIGKTRIINVARKPIIFDI